MKKIGIISLLMLFLAGCRYTGPEMISVKGGTFLMGCTDDEESNYFAGWEKPVHEVTLSGYKIGKFPITQAQWRKVMGATPNVPAGCDDCPITNVSWDDITGLTGNYPQPAVVQFTTIEAEDFVKHPKGTEEDHGFKYKVRFTVPERYADKAVLKTLQQRFVTTLQSWYFQNPDDEPMEDYSSLPPEKAVKAIADSWKAKYNEEIRKEADDPKPDWTTFWEFNYSNTIPFVNETLLQLQTETYQFLGGAHGTRWFSCHLFNLQTGETYTRDDIFKPEAAARIHRLLLNYWEVESLREVGFIEDNVWTENTAFAVMPRGITYLYSDYELGSYALGCTKITIPYDIILPYLREGTPVWEVAKSYVTDDSETLHAPAPATVPETTPMDDDQFLLLMDKIYYNLPASVMPVLETLKMNKGWNPKLSNFTH